MDLGAKLKLLREHAGKQRGLQRALTQSEVAQAIQQTVGGGISQSYLSQLERGQRVHLSSKSREQLATFFGVHPGYLVSDPIAAGLTTAPPAEHTGLQFSGMVPFHYGQAQAHHTLARLSVHPRQQHIWPIVDKLIDLPDDEFHHIRNLLATKLPGTAEARSESAPQAPHIKKGSTTL